MRDRMMIEVLEDISSFLKEDPEFISFISTLPFIPSGNELKAVVDLYDPEVEGIKNLYSKDEHFFPTGLFRKPNILIILRQLGLRKKLFSNGFLERARSIEMNPSQVERSMAISLALFEQLHNYLDEFESDTDFINQLLDIEWIPNHQFEQEDLNMKTNKFFFKPKEIRPFGEFVIPSIMPTTSSSLQILNNKIYDYLQWNKKDITLEQISMQLNVLSDSIFCNTKEFDKVVNNIYKWLQKYITDDHKTSLHTLKFIWIGSQFVTPKQIVKSEDNINLAPVLFTFNLTNFISIFTAFHQLYYIILNLFPDVILKTNYHVKIY